MFRNDNSPEAVRQINGMSAILEAWLQFARDNGVSPEYQELLGPALPCLLAFALTVVRAGLTVEDLKNVASE